MNIYQYQYAVKIILVASMCISIKTLSAGGCMSGLMNLDVEKSEKSTVNYSRDSKSTSNSFQKKRSQPVKKDSSSTLDELVWAEALLANCQ